MIEERVSNLVSSYVMSLFFLILSKSYYVISIKGTWIYLISCFIPFLHEITRLSMDNNNNT